MPKGVYQVPFPENEPVFDYAPKTDSRKQLEETFKKRFNQEPTDIPMFIGGNEVRTDDKVALSPPFDHGKVVAHYNRGNKKHVKDAINAALAARESWVNLSWEHRAAIFLKAADLISGPYRYEMNAATMIAQSKNAFQSEIDSVCELIDQRNHLIRFHIINYEVV